MTLLELGKKHGTDKGSTHAYLPIYDDILTMLKPKDLLEVGVGRGGSLRLWRDYCPNTQVYGLDVKERHLFQDDRITTMLANSTKTAEVDRVLQDQTFDLIIDDGSHKSSDQYETYLNLSPRLNTGGVYVIEDVIDLSSLLKIPCIEIIDLRKISHRYDDMLVVFGR